MNSKRPYIVLSMVLLFLFLGIKVLSYHSVTHAQGEDAVHCELCMLVMHNEILHYNAPADIAIPTPELFLEAYNLFIGVPSVYAGQLSPERVFYRPPPILA